MNHETCIEKLEQFVLDESRIVTYKVLSRELNIHVNEAKQYLQEFLEKQKSENVSLNVMYFLAGVIENGIKIFVVPEKDLEKTKNSLSEITSCHIYSISKKNMDQNSLYLTDENHNKNDQELINFLVIKHPNLEMRAPILTKVNGLKKEMKVSIPKKESKSSFKIAAVNAVQKNEEEHPESNKSNQVAKPSVNGKSEAHAPIKKSNTETKTSKPNTLASMWQRSESKKNENSKPGGKSKSNSSLETKPAPKHSILSMLSKQAEKKGEISSKKSSTVMELSSKTEVICSKEDENKDNVSPPKIKEEIKSSKIQNKKKTSETKVKSCKQKRNDSDDDCQPRKKKHRRICTFDDSDSDSESESEEAKDKALRDLCRRALDDDDSEEPIPPTPPVGKGKKKMWKSLPKTYKDEEGFLVTKQEKVLVSEDDEDPLPNEKSKDKETVNKSNQFTYRKQASLTSFFKQK